MQFSTSNLLSIENILADVTVAVGDKDMKKLTKGWYSRRVKRAIDDLNYSTFFLTMPPYDVPMPQSAAIMLPSGAWNIKDLFAFNGNCCTVETQQTIHPKLGFVGKPRTSDKSVGYTSRNNQHNQDPLYTASATDSSILFYSIDNGRILLSDSCLMYQNLRIVYNGIASEIDKSLIIPPFVAESVIATVTERALFSLKIEEPNLRLAWADAVKIANDLKPTAEYRLKRLSTAERKSIYEYMSRLNY